MKKFLLVIGLLVVLFCSSEIFAKGEITFKQKKELAVIAESLYYGVSPAQQFCYYELTASDLKEGINIVFNRKGFTNDSWYSYWFDYFEDWFSKKDDFLVMEMPQNTDYLFFDLDESESNALFFNIYFVDKCKTRMVLTKNQVVYVFFGEDGNEMDRVTYLFN